MQTIKGVDVVLQVAIPTSEVQSFDLGMATAGTFSITFDGATTTPLNWNDDAATIQAALEALSTIGAGNVVVAGGPLPASVTLTFQEALAGLDVPEITITDIDLTGATITIATDTPGGTPLGFTSFSCERGANLSLDQDSIDMTCKGDRWGAIASSFIRWSITFSGILAHDGARALNSVLGKILDQMIGEMFTRVIFLLPPSIDERYWHGYGLCTNFAIDTSHTDAATFSATINSHQSLTRSTTEPSDTIALSDARA